MSLGRPFRETFKKWERLVAKPFPMFWFYVSLPAELEAETGSDGVGAAQGRGRLVGVVDGEAHLIIVLAKGHVDRQTGAEAVVGGGGGAAPEAGLHDVATAQLDYVEQAVLDTDGVVVAQEGVGGEGSGQSDALIPLLNQEVVGDTDVEASGKLHLGGTRLDGEVVAGGVDHLQREAGATELHRRTPVLQGDTELELVVLTGDILDTGIDTQTRSRDVVGALGDHLEGDGAMNGVGKAVSVGHIDVHVGGREGTIVAGFRIIVPGDIDVAKAHRHDIHTGDTAFEDADAEAEGVDGGAAGQAVLATIEHGVGVAHLDIVDEGKTCHIGEHGTQTAHVGYVDATPTGVACPRVDEQLGGTGCTTAFVIAGQGRLRREGRKDHNYSKYSKYIFHLL